MSSPLLPLIVDRIRSAGPLTVAEYVETALYHPNLGYYTSATQRSGREGDFFTSVDLGPLFGELLAVQLGEMWRLIGSPAPFDVVEAAAGNGRLSRDVLDAAAASDPRLLAATRLWLVERSPGARAAQPAALGPHAGRLHASGDALPPSIEGVIFANELLDALPPHLVTMRGDGLRELFVHEEGGRLVLREGPLSSPRIERYLVDVGARLEPGAVAEVNLAAADWVRSAASAIARGFLLVVDYGREARDLYSAGHGTLISYRGHASEAREDGPGWLREPGERDLTSHVDLTGVRRAAEAGGMTTLGVVDQTCFLLGLGVEDRLANPGADAASALRRRLALKTLMLPGGMGSTHQVMIFAKNAGSPTLKGMARRPRLA
jgi:SAM-dependent MidA family methyltransferase